MASTLAYLPHVKGSDVTNEMLTKMRTDQSFDHCSPGWRTDTSKKATRSGQTGGWCCCTWAISPNCQRSLLRRVYYEAIDLIVSTIDQRFNQESFSSYAQLETFLVKAANGNDYEAEFKILEASYSKDVDSLRTADVSPRSMPQTFPLVTGLSAAMSEGKRLPFAG